MLNWSLDLIQGTWSSCGSCFGCSDSGVGAPSSGLELSQLGAAENFLSFCVTASSVVPTSLAWCITWLVHPSLSPFNDLVVRT